MNSSLRSVRIAPKKAQLVAKMIRGKAVPDAVHILEHTNKKAARIFEKLLRSAMANASHNEKQDPQMMVIKLLTVNKAQAYHRGVPMARGRVRPMRKFLSHINMTLGVAGEVENGKRKTEKGMEEKKSEKSSKDASQKAKKPVKKTPTTAKKPSTSTKGKSKKDTTTSTSKSSTSKKSPKK